MILLKSQPTWKLSKKIKETTESQPLSAAGDLRGEGTQATILQRGKLRIRVETTTGSGPHGMWVALPRVRGVQPQLALAGLHASLPSHPVPSGLAYTTKVPENTPPHPENHQISGALPLPPHTYTLGRVGGDYSISFYIVMQLEQSLTHSKCSQMLVILRRHDYHPHFTARETEVQRD